MANAMAQQVVEQAVVGLARQLEAQVDAEITRLEHLNDDDIDSIRQKRLKDLRTRQQKTREWMERGHGEYTELDDEQAFFKAMKGEERMVCHFYRENWPCKVMDKHMALLAKKHLETKFVRINAEKSPFLTERLKIWMLPTLALIQHEKTVDYVVGFDQLGGKEDFSTEALQERLAKSEMLDYDFGAAARAAAASGAHAGKSLRSGQYMKTESDEDSDFD